MFKLTRWRAALLVTAGILVSILAARFAAARDSGWLAYTMPPGRTENQLTLRVNGPNIELLDSASRAVLQSRPLAATTGVTIQGAPGDVADTLTVDLSSGALAVRDGIHFDGGAGGYNTLEIAGGEAAQGSYLATGPGSGVMTEAGTRIYFSNLAPIVDTTTATNFTINATAASETINIVNGPSCGASCLTTQVNSASASFESVSFANKTNVTVNGLGGADTFNLNNPNPATGLSSLFLDGGGNPGDAIGITSFNLPGGTLELSNAISVTQSGILTVANLGVNVAGPVSLGNSSNQIATVAGATTAAGASFTLRSNVPTLTVGVPDGISGITTANGSLLIENVQPGGALVVDDAIATNGGNITSFADHMSFNAAFSAGSGTLYLDTWTLNEPIALGTKPSNMLGLLQSDLNAITAGTLRIGDAATNTGGMTLTAPITSTAGWSTLDLRQKTNIIQQFTGSLSVPNLVFQTGGGSVDLSQPAGNHVSALAGATHGGNLAYLDAGQTTISTVGGIVGLNSGGGRLTVVADRGGLTVNNNVLSGAGLMTLAAVESNSPTDNVTVAPGVLVSSTTNSIYLQAGDQINLGAGSTVAAGGAGSVALELGFDDADGIGGATIAGTVSGAFVTASGGNADDSLLIDFTHGASLPNELSYDGQFGQNSLTISDVGGSSPHLYEVSGLGASRDFTNLIHCTRVDIITINAGSGADSFGIRPDAGVTFHVNGGLPGSPPGDDLFLNLTGATNATLAITSSDATGFAGSWTFGNRQPVYFSGIDTLDNLSNKTNLPLIRK